MATQSNSTDPSRSARQHEAARVAAQEAAARNAQQEAERKAAAEEHNRFRDSTPVNRPTSIVAFYAGNEVAGDQQIKGKWAKVEGKVDRVGKDILGHSYLTFQGDPASIRTVQAFFSAAHEAELAKLRPGDHVMVFGKCTGLAINVLMEECEFVP